MGALSLDSFEQSSLGNVKYDVTDKLEGLNKSFKSSVESVEGKFGKAEQAMGDAISKVDGFNESGNAIKSYFSDEGKLLSKVERTENGKTNTFRYDDNGNEYIKEVFDSVKNETKIEVKPDTEIVKGNFYAKTDQFGRTVSSKISDLQVKETGTGREALSDNLVNKSYKAADERGHIIADRFGGPATKENIVPQDHLVNTSDFKRVENTVAKLKAEGHSVDYEVKSNYVGSQERPSSFEPHIKCDGKEYELPEDLRKIYNKDNASGLDKKMANVGEKVGFQHEAGVESAKIAATVTCAISTVDNVTACLDGEITADQAAINIAKDTGTAAVTGYGAGFISNAVSSSMAGSSNALISSLGNSCVPAAAVSFGIASYETVVDYAQGEITTEEFAYDMGENAVGVAGSIGGAALAGAAVGSVVPVAGTAVGAAVGVVGGMVGYAVATGAYETAVEAAGDAIEEHADEIKQLGDKAQSIANDTIDKAAALGENAVSDVKEAISNFNIQNKLPW